MGQIDLVVYDFDGTLARLHIDNYCNEVERLFPLLGAMAPPRESMLPLIREQKLFDVFDESIRLDAYREFNRISKRVPTALIDGALETVSQIAAEGRLNAIATARYDDPIEFDLTLSGLGLAEHIDLSSTFFGRDWKDKVQQLRQIAESLDVPVERALMIGDGHLDVAGGKGAGYSCAVGVLTGVLESSDFEQAGAHVVLKDITELPKLITSLN